MIVNHIAPLSCRMTQYALTCKDHQIKSILEDPIGIAQTLINRMSFKVLSWDYELSKNSCKFRKVYSKEHPVHPSVDSFDVMHVQLRFRSSIEMERALMRELNFTS